MLKRFVIALVLAMASAIPVVSLQAPAQADVPQPIYKCLRPHSSTLERVSTPAKCRHGVVYVYSTYDNKLHGKLDMEMLEIKMHCKGGVCSLQSMINACKNNLICSAVVGDIILRGVKVAYRFLKPLLG